MNIAAQIVGIAGIVFSLLSFQLKKRKHIMLFQMTASLMFSAQLFMVGAITGGCLDLISFVRTLIFANNSKKWASSRWWLVGFIGVMIATGLLLSIAFETIDPEYTERITAKLPWKRKRH